MPCTDGMTDSERYREDTQILKERLDTATRLLCYLMFRLEKKEKVGLAYKANDDTSHQLYLWWEDHKKVDEEERIKHLQENAKERRAFLIMQKLNEEFSEEEIEELKDLI
jgi:hypothetical protein